MAAPCPPDDAMSGRLMCAASALYSNRADYLKPVLEQGSVLIWLGLCTVAVHWIVKKVTPPENDSESWNGFVQSTYGDERDEMGKT
ncbi:uncharacterized protein BKCO1_6000015 [Diplodia corticola]|uniref:Uncharacterized protein n=1 Tax=Diplodia corticola TaxID=236234 RepID=A0A1J9QR06_9PEZI|nr:uncharacterized protein BKCO1_6000015 [Diplodia corticola]OJD30450.1 hypothetical protein BKCO1_6000015 [Diplodia corticola]